MCETPLLSKENLTLSKQLFGDKGLYMGLSFQSKYSLIFKLKTPYSSFHIVEVLKFYHFHG